MNGLVCWVGYMQYMNTLLLRSIGKMEAHSCKRCRKNRNHPLPDRKATLFVLQAFIIRQRDKEA